MVGLAGWSGAGKTTLMARLIPAFLARGLRVSTIKHAHHGFDVDQEGKDSWVHRAAGADSVLVCSDTRWALMHELRGAPEPTLAELLALLPPADLVLVEGFKRGPQPRLEVFRAANGKPPLHPGDPGIVGLVSDRDFPDSPLPAVGLDDLEGAAALALRVARPAATLPGA